MTKELKETFECRACRIAKRVEHVMWYVVGLIVIGLWVTALFLANYLLIFEFEPFMAMIMIIFDIVTVWVASTVAGCYFERKCKETKRLTQAAIDEARWKRQSAARNLAYQQRVNALKKKYGYLEDDNHR